MPRGNSNEGPGLWWGRWTVAAVIVGVVVVVIWPSQFTIVAFALGAFLLARPLCQPWLILGRDDVRRELILYRNYLTRTTETRIPLDRITSIEEVHKPGTLFGRHVVVITDDGQVTPVRSPRRGHRGKEDLCGKVRQLAFESGGSKKGEAQDNPALATAFIKLSAVFGRIGIALAILCLGVCVLIGSRTLYYVLTAHRATGTISKLDRVESAASARNGGVSVSFVPHFRFQDASGETYEVRSNVASAASSVKIGDLVPVLYNPSRPNEATIATVGNTWGGTLIAGAIFAAMGILSLRVGRLALYYSNKIREAMLAQASRTPLSQPEVS